MRSVVEGIILAVAMYSIDRFKSGIGFEPITFRLLADERPLCAQKPPFVAVPSVGGWFDNPLASVVVTGLATPSAMLDFHNHLARLRGLAGFEDTPSL
jgi:hypothetical protein